MIRAAKRFYTHGSVIPNSIDVNTPEFIVFVYLIIQQDNKAKMDSLVKDLRNKIENIKLGMRDYYISFIPAISCINK